MSMLKVFSGLAIPAIAALALTVGLAGQQATAGTIVMDIGSGSGNSNSRTGTVTSGTITYNSIWVGSVSNLSATDGSATTVNFLWVDYSSVQYLNHSTLTTTGAAAAIFPDGPAQTFFGAPSGGSFTFKFTGLDAAGVYDLTFFGGHALGSDSTHYTATGTNALSGDLVTANNASNVLTLAGVSPTGAGEIVGTVSASAGSNAYYIGAVAITQQEVPEPATMALLAMGGLAVIRRRR